MYTQQEIDRQFRDLHDAQVKAYQERVQRWKEQSALEQERLRIEEKEVRENLKKNGTDLEFLDQRAKKAQAYVKAEMEKVRPPLANRPSRRAMDYKERALSAARLEAAGGMPGGTRARLQLPVYATSLIAADPSFLDGIPGEMGNGWVFPSNPGQINLKDTSTGDGWGCFWAVAQPPPPTFSIWYTFIPNQTASWELTAVTAFHGFYILRADDAWYNCKSAEVHLEINMDVFQYNWFGQQNFKLVDIEKDNVNVTENYDLTRFTDVTVGLRAGDPVLVKVEVTLDAFALGGGSYAEINFSDGNANYIEPLFLSVQTV